MITRFWTDSLGNRHSAQLLERDRIRDLQTQPGAPRGHVPASAKTETKTVAVARFGPDNANGSGAYRARGLSDGAYGPVQVKNGYMRLKSGTFSPGVDWVGPFKVERDPDVFAVANADEANGAHDRAKKTIVVRGNAKIPMERTGLLLPNNVNFRGLRVDGDPTPDKEPHIQGIWASGWSDVNLTGLTIHSGGSAQTITIDKETRNVGFYGNRILPTAGGQHITVSIRYPVNLKFHQNFITGSHRGIQVNGAVGSLEIVGNHISHMEEDFIDLIGHEDNTPTLIAGNHLTFPERGNGHPDFLQLLYGKGGLGIKVLCNTIDFGPSKGEAQGFWINTPDGPGVKGVDTLVEGNIIRHRCLRTINVAVSRGAKVRYNTLIPMVEHGKRSRLPTPTAASGLIEVGTRKNTNGTECHHNIGGVISSPVDRNNGAYGRMSEAAFQNAMPYATFPENRLLTRSEMLLAAQPNPNGPFAGLGAAAVASKYPQYWKAE